MTDYMILRRQPGEQGERTGGSDPDSWVVAAGVARASSARRALANAELGAGEYVAIPSRSWKPLTVKVETTKKVTIE
jgi:hypothetical protein